MRVALVVGAVGVSLVLAGCGSGSSVESGGATTAVDAPTTTESLDTYADLACSRLSQWAGDATTLNADEMHSAIKSIHDAGGVSDNTTIRDTSRMMLEAEVAGDAAALIAAAEAMTAECVS